MLTSIAQFALLVKDYDDAIGFYCEKLGLQLIEDTTLPGGKRWVRIGLKGGAELVLSQVDPSHYHQVGNQAAGRVLYFLHTDDFIKDYERLRAAGVTFLETPRYETYGSVAVMQDLYGNRIDLIQPKRA